MPPPQPKGSLFGQSILNFVPDVGAHSGSAYEVAEYLVTHGNKYPLKMAIGSLGTFDRVVFDILSHHTDLPLLAIPEPGAFAVYVNSLGSLHLRNADVPPVSSDETDEIMVAGYFLLAASVREELDRKFSAAVEVENGLWLKIKASLDAIHAAGQLPEVLREVADHVDHVESVCFFVGDKFYARIDRFINLIDRRDSGCLLTRLTQTPYEKWTHDEVLVIATLHALFLSGRAVRFEEFNGTALTATKLWDKLFGLLKLYQAASRNNAAPTNLDLFNLARTVRSLSLDSEGQEWLRYRWIYGLNFQKCEDILVNPRSTEDPDVYRLEFSDDYDGSSLPHRLAEASFFRRLACVFLERDLRGEPCLHGNAAAGWIEYLIEKIVASAVRATNSDYGMSSSIRNLAALVEPEESKLLDVIHGLQNTDFYTCFVSCGFQGELEASDGHAIAESVQRRMMFNRWHFIPGNLDKSSILKTRHWFYPPVIPDIAVHSDVHRSGHARARVKYSVRSPGPDMSRPALKISGRPYRGFYDVRVVRMSGEEFGTEEMLRTRRRTLWLESLFEVLVDFLQTNPGSNRPITGFLPGVYCDLQRGTLNLNLRPVQTSPSCIAKSKL